jgi:hypothetical protein
MKELLQNITTNPRTTMHGLAVGALIFAGIEAEGHWKTGLLVAGALAGIVLGFLAKDPK